MFLLVAFALGGYVYSTIDLKQMIAKTEGLEGVIDNSQPDSNADTSSCHDLLIQRGSKYLLYNTKLPEVEGTNPVTFNSLEEYGAYFQARNKLKGLNCPPLFLQQENDAQGNDVYRVRPSPSNPFAGVSANSPLLRPYDGKMVKELDASRDNGYNQNMYPGFDPDNLFIGRKTDVDVVHDSTKDAKMSDNPMDTNWGGILYTQAQFDSGKYAENSVESTNYAALK
jgi:hypothetical protein